MSRKEFWLLNKHAWGTPFQRWGNSGSPLSFGLKLNVCERWLESFLLNLCMWVWGILYVCQPHSSNVLDLKSSQKTRSRAGGKTILFTSYKSIDDNARPCRVPWTTIPRWRPDLATLIIFLRADPKGPWKCSFQYMNCSEVPNWDSENNEDPIPSLTRKYNRMSGVNV